MNDPVGLTSIALRFGRREIPVLLSGGQGETWKVGNIILKPTADIHESEELAILADKLSPTETIRLPRPVKSTDGQWVVEGFVAWSFLEGKSASGRYPEKLIACDAFNAAFSGISKPRFMEGRDNPWSIADKVTWGELNRSYDGSFGAMISHIQSCLQPVTLPAQIIHGDIAGNMVFLEGNPVGVIDLTLYWRPADYTKALLVVDAITWENADKSLYVQVEHLPQMRQLVLRAGLRRIIENPEQIKAFGKDPAAALSQARAYYGTLQTLGVL